MIYFDSFGVWPPKELGKIRNFVYKEYHIQYLNSSSCGLYCIYITLVNTQIFATDIISILEYIRCVDLKNDIHFC